jgi:hypothetical protein
MSVFQTQAQATLQQLCSQIQQLPRDATSRNLAKERGLDIVEVAWEDTARNKFSSYGPNISDLTLLVSGVRMPLFRPPNYTDFTWDVAMDQVSCLDCELILLRLSNLGLFLDPSGSRK